MSNTQRPKKAPTKSPVAAVPDQPEQTEMPEGLRLQIENEQQRLQVATMQAQLNYLSARVSELAEENYNLKEKLK